MWPDHRNVHPNNDKKKHVKQTTSFLRHIGRFGLVPVQDGHEIMDIGIGGLCNWDLQHGDFVHDARIELGMELSGTIDLLPTCSRLLALM